MIELRNNEIADGPAQADWGEKLATILKDIAKAIGPTTRNRKPEGAGNAEADQTVRQIC